MTATPLAQGTSLKCDAPRCTKPATVDRDVWSFCDEHANENVTPAPVRTAPRPAPQPAVAINPSATGANPTASPAMPQILGGGTIGLLLEQASGHSNSRVRKAADRIETQLEQLRALIADLADDERRKKTAAAVKEKARADIERLEAQLAAAKAALRGKPRATTPARTGSETKTCKDCGGPVTREPGQPGRIPSRCNDCRAKA
jgi:hypothetical protein